MASLRELTKIERGLVDSLSNLELFVETYDDEKDKIKISTRLDRLEAVFSEYRKNRAKIETRQEQELSLTTEPADAKERQVQLEVEASNKKSRVEFENRYFDVKDFLSARHVQPTAAAIPSLPHPLGQPITSRIHLPVFKIPSFDGSVKDWLSFRDSFQSMIDKDPSLTAVDKFHYLLTVLSKDAKTLVESIEVTTTNYEVAWTMLKDRFENRKIITRTLMDGFLDTDPMKKESYDGLVMLIDLYERNLLQLKKLGLVTDGWSHLLAHLLYKRLDSETQRHWERSHKSREAPKYQELLKFLREHLTTLQPLTLTKIRGPDQRHESSNFGESQWLESCKMFAKKF
ncbi:uncharacterized protein LOC131429305 [Malaya genurostris]|uniref:uncharacterized protein LOC131429305 n=1 Tax=Malaya genurostris TaxID=325434 RepID=UPI0026F3AA56|nr:uncharacterized protein LOC131429305 [Malaya genurostris]